MKLIVVGVSWTLHMQLYATSERSRRGDLRFGLCIISQTRCGTCNACMSRRQRHLGRQTGTLSRTVCLRAVVRVDRADLVAGCEMCSHRLLRLITDPRYPNGKACRTRKESTRCRPQAPCVG